MFTFDGPQPSVYDNRMYFYEHMRASAPTPLCVPAVLQEAVRDGLRAGVSAAVQPGRVLPVPPHHRRVPRGGQVGVRQLRPGEAHRVPQHHGEPSTLKLTIAYQLGVGISWHLTIQFRFGGRRLDCKTIIDASRCNYFFFEFATQSLLITSYFCDDH